MHTELVEKKRWVSESQFLHALNYCMLLPGPEAQQLAIYIGWLLHRTIGGVVAGVLFVLPSALILWLLSWLYISGQKFWFVVSFFEGLKPAVIAIIICALLRISKKTLGQPSLLIISVLAFVALAILSVPFPIVIFGSLFAGILIAKYSPATTGLNEKSVKDPLSVKSENIFSLAGQGKRFLRVLTSCLLIWWSPVLLVYLILGSASVQFQQALFFSGAALVTFGGAYAVLPYVAEVAVQNYHWLSGQQMIDGLAFAETTPGPLIMVLQFVGFLGGWQLPPHGITPVTSATLSALITTWVTFLPCFLWIFLGAPFIETLKSNAKINSALSAVTAAVLGVIANLAVWLLGETVFRTGLTNPNWTMLGLTIVFFIALHKFKLGLLTLIALAGVTGLLLF